MRHPATYRRHPASARAASWARAAAAVLAAAAVVSGPAPASAQDSVAGVLAFLLAPRSIDTGDGTADAQAAAAVGRAFAGSLQAASTMLPAATSAGGFAFRVDSDLGGAVVRSSASFGSFFTDRALTGGRGVGSLDIHARHVSFDAFDGRALRDGTLLATASRIAGESDPVDVESVALRLDAGVVTLTSTYGVADRVDVTGVVPFVRIALRGERTGTYGGQTFPLSSGEATAAGIGDVAVRVRYNLLRRAGSGVAVTTQVRLPTGREKDLLGSGDTTVQPGLIGSFERDRVAVDGSLGYAVGGSSRALVASGAATVMATPSLMLVGEVSARRFTAAARLVDEVAPNPRLAGIETIRLSAIDSPGTRLLAIGGVKWNPTGSWLLSASVQRRVTTGGLTAAWAPGVSLEYVLGL